MSRTTRKYQENVYIVKGFRNTYIVTLERRKNDVNGNPKYHAVVAVLDEVKDGEYCYNAVYDFTGHYLNAEGESRWIVAYYEGKNK
nr:MAG TPA: hypothetical protein [Caudoviricetes sp.]